MKTLYFEKLFSIILEIGISTRRIVSPAQRCLLARQLISSINTKEGLLVNY